LGSNGCIWRYNDPVGFPVTGKWAYGYVIAMTLDTINYTPKVHDYDGNVEYRLPIGRIKFPVYAGFWMADGSRIPSDINVAVLDGICVARI